MLAIGKLGVPVAARVMPLLDHSYSEMRKTAAATLGALGAVEAVERLAALAGDADIEVRKAAVRALDEIALRGRGEAP